MTSSLAGKVAVVTGASKGIGAAVAVTLAAQGACVVVNYAGSEAAANAVVKTIRDAGGEAVALQADVSRSADVKALIAGAISEFGRLDILVNNAGVYEYGSLDEFTEAQFHTIFDVDVLGLLLATQAAVARMDDGGSVINVGSVASRYNMPGTLVYAAAKNATDGITKVLSQELKVRGIRVNSVNPGLIETEGTRAAGFFGGTDASDYASSADLGTPGRPEDIAEIVAFLASDASRWVSGECIVATGPN
jgi:3-oxoacyl-[acyl-carrier protein] reductase